MKSKERASFDLHTRIAELELLLKRTDILFSIAEAGVKSTDLVGLLNLIVENIVYGTEANRVSLITVNEEASRIDHFVRGGYGAEHIDLSVSYAELMDGLSGWAIHNRQSALSLKDKPDPRESAAVQQRRRETNCGSIIVTPIRYQSQILGTITTINRPEDRNFTTRDIMLIEAAAGEAAFAIVKASLYEQLAEANRLLKDHESELEKEITERKQIESRLKASEDKFRQLIELAPDALLMTDSDGKITLTNALCQKMFGYAPAELVDQQVEILLPDRFQEKHKIDRQKFYEDPQQRLMGSGGTPELIGIRKDRIEFPVEVSLSPLHLESGFAVMAAIRDISIRKRLELEIVHHARQLTALNKLSRNVVSTFDLEQIYVFAHQTVVELMPMDAFYISLINEQEDVVEYVYMFDLGRRYPNEHTPLFTQSLTTHVITSKKTLFIKDDQEGISKSIGMSLYGTLEDTRSVLIAPMIENDKVIGVISAQHYQPNMYTANHVQLLELLANQVAIAILNARLHIALRHEAIRDPLTALFNRRFMEEVFEKEILKAKRNTLPLSIAFIDVDYFKQINDRFGHDAGDLVLSFLGKLIGEHIRGSDVACRYGGEEFALILPGASIEDAFQRMEQLRQDIKYFSFNYQEQILIQLTCSVGVATYPEHGLTKGLLLKSADRALYRAKNNGRDQVHKAT